MSHTIRFFFMEIVGKITLYGFVDTIAYISYFRVIRNMSIIDVLCEVFETAFR